MDETADAATASLSRQERQVLVHMANGLTYCAIAQRMQISRHTVDTYIRRVRAKTGARNRMQLLMHALLLDGDTDRVAEETGTRLVRATAGSTGSASPAAPPNSAFLPVLRHRRPGGGSPVDRPFHQECDSALRAESATESPRNVQDFAHEQPISKAAHSERPAGPDR